MTAISDQELIHQFKQTQDKESAFKELIRRYQERLYWHIRKIVISHDDADDVLQNTFIKIWHGLEKFREDSQLFTWLYRIATNESITFLNKKKKSFSLPIEDVQTYLENNLESDVYYSGDEIQKKLQKAIITLPEKQRIVFNMKYFDEMKYEDMAEILETSTGALKASFHHAVKKIESFLKAD